MTQRRSLVDGLKDTPPAIDPEIERKFVFQSKGPIESDEPRAKTITSPTAPATPPIAKAPISTRIRADLANALKRASLERQLGGVEPNTVQDILEQVLEPWLRANGYLE